MKNLLLIFLLVTLLGRLPTTLWQQLDATNKQALVATIGIEWCRQFNCRTANIIVEEKEDFTYFYLDCKEWNL